MKKIVFTLLILVTMISCDQKVIQYPVSYANDDFMQRSQERGKKLYQEELQWFDEYIKSSKEKFVKTNSGFWISNEEKQTSSTANKGDYVEFEYQVSDLKNNIIYSYQDNKIQKVVIGKSDLTRGVNAALQLLSEGESAKLLLPSFLAYGGYGDQSKIAPDEPIIIDLKIIKINKH
ncbi:FKBP-type peptidyl-prolyl cis-trans isomerase [Chishuiella sp.]|uniref:FKBP-type peptidyl-prolyl cis-trans isomerase n=1 Tax=Chishuiella sp. TaxID=1969467 RepID=UPI0028ACFBDD|nr:FKBP-type peptidyl-prolyl cis-trans isomerase [Chishuiella sp.]